MHIRDKLAWGIGSSLVAALLISCGRNETTAQSPNAATHTSVSASVSPKITETTEGPRGTATPRPPEVTRTPTDPIAKATALALRQTQLERESQTHPTRIPRATPDPEVWGTPVPPGYIPEKEKAVLAVEKKDVGAIHPLREATSIWKNGVVRSANLADWYPLYIYAMVGKDNYPIIAPLILNATQELEYTFPKLWECPRPIGAITITAITEEPLGIVSFTSKSGTSGTLNMATGEWAFSS
jgi:hypothetical protein